MQRAQPEGRAHLAYPERLGTRTRASAARGWCLQGGADQGRRSSRSSSRSSGSRLPRGRRPHSVWHTRRAGRSESGWPARWAVASFVRRMIPGTGCPWSNRLHLCPGIRLNEGSDRPLVVTYRGREDSERLAMAASDDESGVQHQGLTSMAAAGTEPYSCGEEQADQAAPGNDPPGSSRQGHGPIVAPVTDPALNVDRGGGRSTAAAPRGSRARRVGRPTRR
jgi:hypothetical protein